MKKTVMIFLMMLTSGCATQIPLIIHSSPPGATIIEKGSGNYVGVAPVAWYYDKTQLNRVKDLDGCYRIFGFDARWASGAKGESEAQLRLCNGPNSQYTVNINRPNDHPGYEEDMNYAMRIQELRYQQQQAQAAQNNQRDLALGILIHGLSNASKAETGSTYTPPKEPKTIKCTSREIGYSIETDCKENYR